MQYKTFSASESAGRGGSYRMYAARNDVSAFVTSFLLTLILSAFAAGMLFVGRGAAEAFGGYEIDPARYETALSAERQSALWSIVGGIFPYIGAAVRLILLLCAFFALLARLAGI